ncbi:hypothetical protein AB0K45_11820 [Micrococcus luteus]|uniref:hypothetical protein n=1 Tax=Micrococcus luteus TaxID=1270 RepID=UPI003430A0E3
MAEDVDPAPTEAGLTAASDTVETHTESITAWSLSDEQDELDGGQRLPSWIVAGVVLAAVIAVGVAVVLIVRELRPAPAATPQSPDGEISEPTAGRPPDATPPSWHLSGTYRFDIRNPEGIVREIDGTTRSMSDLGVTTLIGWGAYKTECEPSGCTARYVKLDPVTHDHPAVDDSGNRITHVDRWNGVEWESADEGPNGGTLVPIECGSGSGSRTFEVWSTLAPLPDGSFRGTTYRSEIPDNACGELPLGRQEVPTTAVRVGDIPPGIFD